MKKPVTDHFHGAALWIFSSTGEAYDACNAWDEILTGDLLLIPNEKVVALADAWPVAVTREHGNLHYAKMSYLIDIFGHERVELAHYLMNKCGWYNFRSDEEAA